MTVRDWRSDYMALFGLLLRRRKTLGLSQQALADRVGFSVLTVKRWESGHCEPSFKALCRWASVLGVSVTGSVVDGTVSDTSEAA